MADLKVGQVMTPHPPTVSQAITVDELVNHHLGQYQGHAIAVTDDTDGWPGWSPRQPSMPCRPSGDRPRPWPRSPSRSVRILMARPDESMDMLLGRMTSGGSRPALVLDADNRLAGVVTPADLQRAGVWLPHS